MKWNKWPSLCLMASEVACSRLMVDFENQVVWPVCKEWIISDLKEETCQEGEHPPVLLPMAALREDVRLTEGFLFLHESICLEGEWWVGAAESLVTWRETWAHCSSETPNAVFLPGCLKCISFSESAMSKKCLASQAVCYSLLGVVI